MTIVVSAGGEYRGETYIICSRPECRVPGGPRPPSGEYVYESAAMFEGDSLDELHAFLREHDHERVIPSLSRSGPPAGT